MTQITHPVRVLVFPVEKVPPKTCSAGRRTLLISCISRTECLR